MFNVCVKIHWWLVKEQVGLLDQQVQAAFPAARPAGQLQLCHRDIHMPLGQ